MRTSTALHERFDQFDVVDDRLQSELRQAVLNQSPGGDLTLRCVATSDRSGTLHRSDANRRETKPAEGKGALRDDEPLTNRTESPVVRESHGVELDSALDDAACTERLTLRSDADSGAVHR